MQLNQQTGERQEYTWKSYGDGIMRLMKNKRNSDTDLTY